MRTDANTYTDATPGQVRACGRQAKLGLFFLLPLLMGGCPEFRDELVSVIETVTRSTLLTTEDTQSIADTATTSLVDATIDLFFDQFRTAN